MSVVLIAAAKCPYYDCNADLSEGASTCSKCRRRVAACPQCGVANRAYASFCLACGEDLHPVIQWGTACADAAGTGYSDVSFTFPPAGRQLSVIWSRKFDLEPGFAQPLLAGLGHVFLVARDGLHVLGDAGGDERVLLKPGGAIVGAAVTGRSLVIAVKDRVMHYNLVDMLDGRSAAPEWSCAVSGATVETGPVVIGIEDLFFVARRPAGACVCRVAIGKRKMAGEFPVAPTRPGTSRLLFRHPFVVHVGERAIVGLNVETGQRWEVKDPLPGGQAVIVHAAISSAGLFTLDSGGQLCYTALGSVDKIVRERFKFKPWGMAVSPEAIVVTDDEGASRVFDYSGFRFAEHGNLTSLGPYAFTTPVAVCRNAYVAGTNSGHLVGWETERMGRSIQVLCPDRVRISAAPVFFADGMLFCNSDGLVGAVGVRS